MSHELKLLHFSDKVKVINPQGHIAILTLWTKVESVLEAMASDLEDPVDLDSATSPIAAIANLYGNGIPELLRNLLHNPQIKYVFIWGDNRSGSREDLFAFLEGGVEKAEYLGRPVWKIKGRERIMDNLVSPEMLGHINWRSFNGCSDSWGDPVDRGYFLKAIRDAVPFHEDEIGERIEVPLPAVDLSHFPSEATGHQIVEKTPLFAWQEVLFRIIHFGIAVALPKGDRKELLDLKVVITDPREDTASELAKFDLRLEDLRAYQAEMLEAGLSAGLSYTYGHRMGEYFGLDCLAACGRMLKANAQSRSSFCSLWDNTRDIGAEDKPCLVTVFFRFFEGRLHLTATYRTHNAVDAWLKNVYGLMAVLDKVAGIAGLPAGSITVLSQSISVDPSRYEIAQSVSSSRRFRVKLDPCGYFEISLAEGKIVARHFAQDGVFLKEYKAKRAERIQYELALDCAISDMNHAIYIGRELAKAEACLRSGDKYEQS